MLFTMSEVLAKQARDAVERKLRRESYLARLRVHANEGQCISEGFVGATGKARKLLRQRRRDWRVVRDELREIKDALAFPRPENCIDCVDGMIEGYGQCDSCMCGACGCAKAECGQC
jgi:hypothetical protein